jgi:hypothetical protein
MKKANIARCRVFLKQAARLRSFKSAMIMKVEKSTYNYAPSPYWMKAAM